MPPRYAIAARTDVRTGPNKAAFLVMELCDDLPQEPVPSYVTLMGVQTYEQALAFIENLQDAEERLILGFETPAPPI